MTNKNYVTRRATVCSLGILLTSGCTSIVGGQSNNLTVVNTYPSNRTEYDGELSSLGYVKFIEQPDDDKLIIQQTFVDARSSCESSNVNITPNSGATNGDPIAVKIQAQKKQINSDCIGTTNDPQPPSGVTIEFMSLEPGQKISFSYDKINVNYTTTGKNNTSIREPVSASDDIRV